MLQSKNGLTPEEDLGLSLSPADVRHIVKRRILYFLLPFTVVVLIGSFAVLAWPAKYLSEGKILVQSPEIPADLVHPTVFSYANERIQVLAQRVLTRDNLLALADKFHINAGWKARLSGTEIVDFIRERTIIAPVEVDTGSQKQAIAFSLGFVYENPQIAMDVANELLTMFLKEDAQSRTRSASATKRFIQADVDRIEGQLNGLDAQIAEAKFSHRQNSDALSDGDQLADTKALEVLRQQLLLKSASYSPDHPDIIALKRKIAALEKSTSAGHATAAKSTDSHKSSSKTDDPTTGDPSTTATRPPVDALETKRASLRKELENATEKLAVARLGETLERDQYSARLQVLEQPTLPIQPVSPNRPKLLAAVAVVALMAGGGLAALAEMFDQSIKTSSSLFSLIDSHLVVTIPYIETQRERRRKKRRMILIGVVLMVVFIIAVILIFFVLPPIDVLIDKVLTKVLNYI
jgi:protein tyrosine kinase modulator